MNKTSTSMSCTRYYVVVKVAPIWTRTRNFHSRVRRFAGLSIPGRDIDFISCSVFMCIALTIQRTKTISSGLPSLDAFLCMQFYLLSPMKLANKFLFVSNFICFKSDKNFTKCLLQDVTVGRYKYLRNSQYFYLF